MRVEWDSEQDRQNRRKHGLSFREAGELFTSGTDYLEIHDEDHSLSEDRFVCVGPIRRGLVVVVTTEVDDDVVRILSARFATRRERDMYRSYIKGESDG